MLVRRLVVLDLSSSFSAGRFLMDPTLDNLKEYNHALFVSEPKSRDVSLEMNVPQAIYEIYACGKELGSVVIYCFNIFLPHENSCRKTIIRGALSDGPNWIFVILKINSDGNGAKYAVSHQIPLIGTGREMVPSRYTCTLISGIISYWASGIFSTLC
jgi:hypothetical protein